MSAHQLNPAGIASLINRISWQQISVDAVTCVTTNSNGQHFQTVDPDKVNMVLASTNVGVPVVVMKVDFAAQTVVVDCAGEIIPVASWFDNGSGPQLRDPAGVEFCGFEQGAFIWRRNIAQTFPTPCGIGTAALIEEIERLKAEIYLLSPVEEPTESVV